MEAAVLQHLLGAARGSGAAGTYAAFDSAASQLQLLGGQAGQAGELVEELLDKAEQLVGSKQATARLLGLQLLRSALANCHRRAFLQQHAHWAALLLATLRVEQQRGQQADKDGSAGAQQQQLQQPSAVAAEACACLAAYFSRIGRMLEVPGLRRDGAAAASKLAGLLLGQGQKQKAAAEQAAAAPPLLALPQGQAALLAALTALPASFRQQHKALEAALLPLLMAPVPAASEGGSSASSPLLAACVAALPRIAGDGSSWSAFCQRLLVTAHRLLDSLLLQLDDAQLAAAARSSVDPSAEPLPLLPAAGSVGALSSQSYAAGFIQLAEVLEALRQMLVYSYPAAVPLPAGGLLLLASRIASVDSSSGGRAAAAAAASSRFPQLCLQLPQLQAAALCLLQQMLSASGSAAAPYFVAAARLLGGLLQQAAAGDGGTLGASVAVRCRLFTAARTLLGTSGVGAVRHLAPPLLAAASAELYGRKQAAQREGDAMEGPARKKARKGKQASVADFAGEVAAAAPVDDLGAAAQQRDQAVQAAALAALQALCTAGAPLLTPQQRRQLDDVAAHVAVTSAAAVCQLSCNAEAAVGPHLAALQLSAYQLLLATVLAPAPHRPPHLAAALKLWRAGSAGGAGDALAAFCRHALLCCEALLHPRSLPPPAPARRLLPAALEKGADGSEKAGQPLGMPLFWSSVDGALLLQQEELAVQRLLGNRAAQQQAAADAQLAAQQHEQTSLQPQANGTLQAADVEMADAAQAPAQAPQPTHALPVALPAAAAAAAAVPVAVVQPSQPTNAPAPAPAAGLSSMAAMLGGSAVPASPAAVPAVPSIAATPGAQAPQPVPPVPAAPAHEFAAAPAPLAAAPAPTAAAAVAAAAAAEESDSEGSLPEIDSGSESSGSDSDEA